MLLTLWAWFWPLYQLTQLPESWLAVLPVRIYLFDLLVVLALIYQRHKVWQGWRHSRLGRALSLLAISIVFSWLGTLTLNIRLNWQQWLVILAYSLRLLAYLSLLFVATAKLTKFAYRAFWLTVSLGLLQYLFLPDVRWLQGIHFDDHYYRLTAPFLDPNYTGLILAMMTLFLLSRFRRSFSHLTLLGLSLVNLSLTFSRASYLALLVGGLALAANRQKLRRWLLGLLLTLATLILLIPKPFGEGVNLARTYSITARWHNLQTGWQLAQQRPLTGLGFNALGFLNSTTPSRAAFGLDNSFLVILVTTGFIGLIAWGYFGWTINKVIGANPGIRTALIALLTHSLLNNSLFYAPTLILAILLIGLVNEHKKQPG